MQGSADPTVDTNMLQNGNVSIVRNVLTVMLEEDDINNIKELGSVGINEKSTFINK